MVSSRPPFASNSDKIARRMSEDLNDSFIVKRPRVAYPEQRVTV